MKRVVLVRHAKTIERSEWEENDVLRPLSDKGRKQSKKIARFLKARYFDSDAIYSSSATRAREMAKIVAKQFESIRLLVSSKIDPESGGAKYASLIEEADSCGFKNIVIIGHENDLSEAVSMLCSNGEIHLRWRKGGVVELTRNGDGMWQIAAFYPPSLF